MGRFRHAGARQQSRVRLRCVRRDGDGRACRARGPDRRRIGAGPATRPRAAIFPVRRRQSGPGRHGGRFRELRQGIRVATRSARPAGDQPSVTGKRTVVDVPAFPCGGECLGVLPADLAGTGVACAPGVGDRCLLGPEDLRRGSKGQSRTPSPRPPPTPTSLWCRFMRTGGGNGSRNLPIMPSNGGRT